MALCELCSLCSKTPQWFPITLKVKRKVLVLHRHLTTNTAFGSSSPGTVSMTSSPGTLSPTPTTYMRTVPQLVHEHQAFSHWTAHAAVFPLPETLWPGYLHGSPSLCSASAQRTSYSGDALCLSHSPLLLMFSNILCNDWDGGYDCLSSSPAPECSFYLPVLTKKYLGECLRMFSNYLLKRWLRTFLYSRFSTNCSNYIKEKLFDWW